LLGVPEDQISTSKDQFGFVNSDSRVTLTYDTAELVRYRHDFRIAERQAVADEPDPEIVPAKLYP
jgi:hypothetical protein